MEPQGPKKLCPYCKSPLVKRGHFLECTKCSYSILYKEGVGKPFFKDAKPREEKKGFAEPKKIEVEKFKAEVTALNPRIQKILTIIVAVAVLAIFAAGPLAIVLLLFLPFLLIPLFIVLFFAKLAKASRGEE